MEISQKSKAQAKVKRIVFASLIAVTVILAVVIISVLIGKLKPQNNSIIVYRNNSSHVVRIDGLSVSVSDSSASNFIADKENKRVLYTVDSSYADNFYDLCYISVDGSEIIGPTIIDYAVKYDYTLIDDNVYYLKYNKSQDAFEGYVCDLEKKTRTSFDINLDGIYPLKESETFLFTKYHADSLSLYKYTGGKVEGPLYSQIKEVHAYNDCSNPHVLFETSQGHSDSLTDLIEFSADGEKLLSDSTYYVDYDRYKQGGNLYFYSSDKNSVSWSYVISDSFVESDKEIVKPNRDDYESEMGVSTDYNEDFIKYQDKLIRDEIRTALNQAVAESGFDAPVYTAYAYSQGKTFKLTEKVDPSRVFAVSEKGAPKIVYDNAVLTPSDVDMSALVNISLRNDLDDVIDYAWSVLADNVYSEGLSVAVSSAESNRTYPLDFYNKKSTLFSFSQDGERLFAFVKDDNFGSTSTVYCNNFNADLSPIKETAVSAGVSGYKVINGSVVYMKEDIGKNTGDIYEFNGNENVKLSNAASAFSASGEHVIVIKNNETLKNSDVADYYFVHGGNEVLIAENVLASSFTCTPDGRVAFVSGDDNSLYFYFDSEKSVIDENVTSIVLFV